MHQSTHCANTTTMTTSTSLQSSCCYRGIIALNNMGIALLQQRDFCSAVVTLKEAIKTVKLLLNQERFVDGLSVEVLDLRAKLDVASKRLAKPNPVPSNIHIAIDAVCYDDFWLHSIWSEGTMIPLSRACFRPIKLECTVTETFVGQDVSLETSIMLYNLGISYLCLSKSMPSTHSRMKRDALKIFQMAYAAIIKAKDDFPMDRNISVAIAIVHCFVLTLHELGYVERASRSNKRLINLVAVMQELQEAFKDKVMKMSAAAA
jgi:hypothetical protein